MEFLDSLCATYPQHVQETMLQHLDPSARWRTHLWVFRNLKAGEILVYKHAEVIKWDYVKWTEQKGEGVQDGLLFLALADHR